jgi:hypothetical protein
MELVEPVAPGRWVLYLVAVVPNPSCGVIAALMQLVGHGQGAPVKALQNQQTQAEKA